MKKQVSRWAASVSVALVLAAFVCVPTAHAQTTAQTRQFNVPAQSATTGIPEFARQAGIQILVSEPLVRGKRIATVTGSHSVPEALEILLRDTGLSASTTDGTTYTVVPNSPHTLNYSVAGSNVLVASQGTQATDNLSPAAPQSSDQSGLEEITVTAQKRSERLQDVPVPVTAINAETLLANNQVRLQDYYATVPGLNVTVDDFGTPLLTIRGVTTGAYTNPTVGITVDDVPFGSSSALGYGQQVFDMDPSDLQRIEVLRGPQGTLYGANSLGGLLKYVTIDPSTDALSGRVEAGSSGVYNGSELGYNFRGSINVPVSDAFAIRASAFTREDPGYVDDIETGQRGVNEAQAYGGRLSALWMPSQSFSLKLSALDQHFFSDGVSIVDVGAGLGDLQQDIVRGGGASSRDVQAYSATLKAKFGTVDMTAVSGYSAIQPKEWNDYTDILGSYSQTQFGVTGTPLVLINPLYKFSQEVRFSDSIGPNLDWLVGGFYTHEDSPETENVLATNPVTGMRVGLWLSDKLPFTYAEYAAFADLTYHFTDRFDVQFGGRESENKQTYSQTFTGPYDGVFLGSPSPVNYAEASSQANSFTYLVTPRFKVSPDLMLYARLASGYRPGGPNTYATTDSGLPPKSNPDTTKNYEIGAKGDTPGHMFSFDASLYYIDWQNIQLALVDPHSGFGYLANGSAAKSEGLELSVGAKPVTGLTISAWVAWNDAVLTQSLPSSSAVYGASGDRLPDSSRFSGSLTVEQAFRLSASVTGFAGGTFSYVGDRVGVFTSGPPAVPPRQDLPAYTKTDLRAGAKYSTWTANLYVNNLTDQRGLLDGGLGTFDPSAFQYIQPRTIGVTVAKTF